MGADMGVFQVADAKTYGYVYLIPRTCLLRTHAGGVKTGSMYMQFVKDSLLKKLYLTNTEHTIN